MRRFTTTPRTRHLVRSLSVLGLGALLLLPSCRAPKHGLTDGAEISKVKYYRFRPFDKLSPATDAMIANEVQYYAHGAYDTSQLTAKEGNYYNIFWNTENPGQPAVVRLDFIQEEEQGKVRRKEIQVPSPRSRRNKTTFEVVGEEFEELGDVRAFKATVLQGGREVANHRSFLWQD